MPEFSGPSHLTRRYSGPPYWLFLPWIGVLVYAFGEGLVALFHDSDYQITQLIFALALGIVPAWLLFLQHKFDQALVGRDRKALRPIRPPIAQRDDLSDEAIGIWLRMRRESIFFLKGSNAWCFVFLIEVAGIASYLYLGPPYRSPIINTLSVVGLAFLLAICAWAAFTMWQLLRLLWVIGGCDFKPPLLRLPHPATDTLFSYYSSLALAAVVGYALFAIALMQGPYPHGLITLGWLSALSLYPIVAAAGSVIQIHSLLRRAKQHQLDEVNKFVTAVAGASRAGFPSTDLDALNKAMSAQETVQALPEWPLSARSVLTLAAALVALLTQMIALWLALIR